jgi:hypothetical protein
VRMGFTINELEVEIRIDGILKCFNVGRVEGVGTQFTSRELDCKSQCECQIPCRSANVRNGSDELAPRALWRFRDRAFQN